MIEEKKSIRKYTAEEIKTLLEKDELTQKVRQSMQTIRLLWQNEYPGDDTERREQYAEGPGREFANWEATYNSFSNPDELYFPQVYSMICTKYTRERILQIMADMREKMLNSETYDEILTQLKAAETYEQEIQILKAYKILDENGVLTYD